LDFLRNFVARLTINHSQKKQKEMKKPLTLLFSAILMIATFVACNRNNEEEYTPETPTVSVTGVSLNPTTASLVVGDTLALVATVSPETATNQAITWSSSDLTVVTALNGTITAVAEGEATITVTTADGNRTAITAVTVTTVAIPVESVSLNKTEVALDIGEDFTLIATILPETATNQAITWSSSDLTVVTVLNGVITAVSEGTATITVTTTDGDFTATSAITVTLATIPVESVSLNETTYTLTVGEDFTLIATIYPENATNQAITWSSSDLTVVTVLNGVITAVSEGTATITVTTADGDFTATSAITVTPAPIPVESVSLDRTSATLVVGNEVTLIATVLPENATNQNITWTSSNTAIATVENGVVTAISGGGVAKITATTEDGNRTSYFTVAVVQTQRGCNTNEPGWGESLGTISWGTVGNTNIETGTTSITGTDGRPNQIWSGAVFATACAKGNATNDNEFSGGVSGNFNADCRQSLHTFNHGRDNGITGDLFSWCAVVRFADQLCPYPWRVPTAEDFTALHQNLGFALPSPITSSIAHGNTGAFMPTTGSAMIPQVGGTWGGARFNGSPSALTTQESAYWSSSEISTTNSRNLLFAGNLVWPQASNNKATGRAVRCVR